MLVKDRIRAYKLRNNIIVLNVLILVFILSLVFYLIPKYRSNEVISNIMLALFTSLLATIFAMAAEIYVSYKSHKNERILEDIHSFGVEGLYRDKEELLRELLSGCDRIIWISGYRLILTKNIKNCIYDAIIQGADVTAVICPPWEEAFSLVYGKNEKVMDNYLEVFKAIDDGRKAAGKSFDKFRIVFVEKPLFSDTYRIDRNLITGPYMHNTTDDSNHRITAKDFFTYNLVTKSELYELIQDEFSVLFKEAVYQLEWPLFEDVYNKIENGDYNEAEKIELLKSACKDITDHTMKLEGYV